MKSLTMPFSESQWNSVVDGNVYGRPYGKELGEDIYIQTKIENMGYKKFNYIKIDYMHAVHIIEVE
jgi:hypothetical protein